MAQYVEGEQLGKQPSTGPHLTYIIGSYPVLTMTFIDREILALRSQGLNIRVISIRRPARMLSEAQQGLQRDVHFVLPVGVIHLVASHARFAITRFGTYLGTLAYLLSRSHRSWRERFKTLLHFGEAIVIADVVRRGPATRHIHAHFVDRAAIVAFVVGRLLDIPYSATAHASEIYVEPVLLPEKIANAAFVATCTQYNADHLIEIGSSHPDHVLLIYHGLDSTSYRPTERRPDGNPLILSVGQLKERKGFLHLIEACTRLRDRGITFRCEIVGDGPLQAELQRQIDAAGLQSHVSLLGAMPHDGVVHRYQDASVFVLPAVLGSDGDRDGIPNVILEAMAMALPVVSTDHSGIPEAVEDWGTGRLVPPGDADALADALEEVLSDDALAREWGRRGRKVVLDRFDVDRNVSLLHDRFRRSMSARASS